MNYFQLGMRFGFPIFRLTVVSGVGLAGYFLGKYENSHSESKVFGNSILENVLSIVPPLSAATVDNPRNMATVIFPDTGKDGRVSGVDPSIRDSLASRNRISEIMKYGFPSLDNIRSYGNFVLSYDTRNRVAHWVFEHLTKDSVKRNDEVDRTKCQFFEDKSIHAFFRATNEDYKRSGYDRGHLAAAGNHKGNQETCEQTFILSNMAPQVGEGFNRHAWNDLEKHVRKLARKYMNVYVCTGPLYLPRVESNGKSYVKYEVIGRNTVAVPTHFFKVILMEGNDRTFEMEAYVMPNEAIQDGTPLKVFQVPVESIERASGLLLFDKLPKQNLKRINGK